jgi:hypothetical protein
LIEDGVIQRQGIAEEVQERHTLPFRFYSCVDGSLGDAADLMSLLEISKPQFYGSASET